MSKSRLLSGKIKKITGSELDADRRLFLDLANAEPDLGNPTIDGSILVADIDGTRYWSPSVKVDLTGNIFLGTINSADGSTPISLTESAIIEGDLTVNGIGNIPEIITQTLKSLDSTTITIENNLDVQNNLTVNGNLTVLGSTTTINSTTLTVEDKNIELAKNSTSAENSDGAGITVIGPTTPATISYDAATDTWNFNKTIVGTVQGATSIQDIDDRINLFFDNDINTSDSSSIVFVPSVEMRSDLTVENDLRVSNAVYADRFIGDGSQLTGISALTISDIDTRINLFFDNDINTNDSSSIIFVPSVEFRSDVTVDNDLRVSNTVYANKFIGDGSQLTGINILTNSDVDNRISLFFDNDINTSDSSAIVLVPSVEMRSDLTVENDLYVSNTVYATRFIGDGSQLTGIVTSGGGSGSQFYATEEPPIGAAQGDFWFDTDRAVLAVYIDDGDSLQWVEVSASGYQGPIGYTGSQGELGYTGSTGIGYTGSQGEIGYTGSQGDIGFVGSQGNIGYTGSAGSGGAGGGVANLYQAGNLTVFTGTLRWYAPFNLEITTISARVVESANNNILIDVIKNGNFLAEITIPTGEFIGSFSSDSTPLTLDEGDYLTVDITQVGSGANPGSDLYLQFKYESI